MNDDAPRLRPHRSCGQKVFWHPCSVCGDKWGGCFGRMYNAKQNKMGEWFCSKCRPDDFFNGKRTI